MDNKLISEKQSAYLRGDSTSQQLLYITHKIRKSWAEGKLSHAVFLDISAAFDGVWHKGLLAKLKQNGITDKALELLESYLSRRRATTVIDNIKSAIADLEAGVPLLLGLERSRQAEPLLVRRRDRDHRRKLVARHLNRVGLA